MAKSNKYLFATSDEDPEHRVATADEILSFYGPAPTPIKRKRKRMLPLAGRNCPFVAPTVEGLEDLEWDRSVKWTDVDLASINHDGNEAGNDEDDGDDTGETDDEEEPDGDGADAVFDVRSYHNIEVDWETPKTKAGWDALFQKKAQELGTPGSRFMDAVDRLIPRACADHEAWEDGMASDPEEDEMIARDHAPDPKHIFSKGQDMDVDMDMNAGADNATMNSSAEDEHNEEDEVEERNEEGEDEERTEEDDDEETFFFLRQ